MKNTLILLSVAMTILCCVSSCKKDKVEQTVVGYWKGKYLGNPNTDWSWVIRANNTVRVYVGPDTSVASKYEGTYTNTDSTISVAYSIGGSLNVVLNGAKISNAFRRIDGQDFVGYKFFLDKQ
ncbi:hypothetical protein [Ferruginibacter sp. HRS2-29]|uniref:hypothetical protein n=1 Tax=Ferruginibacter sp. HRS2-29 TaxID=2487334 RepID=UPI0020CCB46B|nr:hypothetical protein [Ferruginibacter sp. HRS2-29]MCP9753232.1 hypothetical protein [Ferruginibacter sp. HRS2-29]